MLTKRVMFLMIVFALAAAGAYAQAGQPVVTSPAPGCPAVTSPSTAAQMGSGPAMTGTTVPSCAVGAGYGGGPLPELVSTPAGPGFDKLYMERMYQVHTALNALTTQGIEQATDQNLKDLSGKIRTEQTRQNQKLAIWYGDKGFGRLNADFCSAGTVVNCLTSIEGPGYDPVYAKTLIDELQTLRASALTSVPKLTDDAIRNQAQLVADVAQNEIVALQRWIDEHPTPGVTY